MTGAIVLLIILVLIIILLASCIKIVPQAQACLLYTSGYGKKSQRHRHYRFKPGGSRRADYYGCTAPEAYGHAF